MNLRPLFLVGGAGLTGLVVASCMSPGQQLAALQAIDALELSLEATGQEVDLSMLDALRSSILEAGTANFWQQLVGTGVSILAAYAGVRLDRGPSATKPERVARKAARRQPRQG